jgi:integrase/recombinase XerD
MENLQNQYIKNYKTYLQELGYSKSSVNMLPACVKEFLTYTNTAEVRELNQGQIQSFYEYLQNRKHKRKYTALSETFISHNIYALKVFFSWLEQTAQIKYNPISNLKFKRSKPNTREPLSQNEIIQIFESTITAKETAILHLFYSCGLRRTEAENINTSDIHFSKNLLYVREGKGAKRRVIPMNGGIKIALENYYNNEREKISEDIFMFNSNKQRMKGDQYNKTLKQILQRTEITKETSLHHLRHSIATHLLENGLSIEFVRDFLGHTHLESTQIYAKVFNHQLKKL